MNAGGDAAEQVVRLSLEGAEVAARVSGEAAKGIAILLAATLRQEQKTRGKSRLTSMLKSGKDLTVFSLQQKDLKQFMQEAKRYGILYCVLKEKNPVSGLEEVDIITRAEDASRVQRVLERFHLAGTVDKASIVSEVLGEKENDAPFSTRTEEGRLSGQGFAEKGYDRSMMTEERPSVREKIKAIHTQRSAAKDIPDRAGRDRNDHEKVRR